MKKKNNLNMFDYSDEWFTPYEVVVKCYEILKPEPNAVILCPYDSEESFFVKVSKSKGHRVIYGITDFLTARYEYDYLFTNPPFSIKDQIIERVLESGKISTLVLPIDTLGGVKRHYLFKKYSYPEVYIPTKRISYFNNDWSKPSGSPNMHSVIMTFNRGTGISYE